MVARMPADISPFKSSDVGSTLVDESMEENVQSSEALDTWSVLFQKLQSKKISWDYFLSQLPVDFWTSTEHPLFELCVGEEGHTVLHLALIHKKIDVVRQLAVLAPLRYKRNRYGLSPYELARYLDCREGVAALGEVDQTQFIAQHNVAFDENFSGHILPQLDYLAVPVYESNAVFEYILSRTKRAKKADQIPPEKIWMGIYFDREMQQSLHPKVALRWIDCEVGFGVFSAQRILSCAFIGEYTGVVLERREELVKDNRYCVRCTTWDTGRKKFVIDATSRGNFTRFINHSAKPNVGLQSIYWRGMPRMVFIALREISEGEQLTFDYGPLFWKDAKQVPKIL